MAESKDPNFNDLNSSKTNTYVKGLIKDYNDSYVPEGVWTNAINAVNNSHMGDMYTIGNEPSNTYCTQATFEVIGVIRLDASRWWIFSTNDISGEIGIFDERDCSYKKITMSSCLNFKRSNLITGATQINYDCSFTVFFADGLNPDRALKVDPDDPNFQNPALPLKYVPYLIAGYTNPNSDCPIPIYDTPPRLDCDKIRLQYLITLPCFTLEKSNSPGTLFNGSYQVTVAYSINGERVTDYFSLSNTAAIWTHENNGGSLDLVFSQLDRNFDEYEVLLISTVNERTAARRIGFYSTTQTVVHIDDNTDALVSIPLEDVPVTQAIYETSDSIYSLNGYLLRSGVTTKPEFNYQPLANQIVTKWVSVEYPADYYIKGNNDTGYMRDEVYSFFIRWVYATGNKSASYHIPGRPARATDLTTVTNNDVLPYDASTKIFVAGTATSGTVNTLVDAGAAWTSNQWSSYQIKIIGGTGFGQIRTIGSNTATSVSVTSNWTTPPDATSVYNILTTTPPGTAFRWKVYNTAITLPLIGGVMPNGGIISGTGYMGYWESTDNYPVKPDVWNSSVYPWSQISAGVPPYPQSAATDYDLCGTSIRHHKFPDDIVSPIFNNATTTSGGNIQLLGVRFENIKNPVDQAGNPIKGVVGYEILRGSREGNRSIIAKGLVHNMWQYSDPGLPGNAILYQNYPFNCLQPDFFLRPSGWFVPAVPQDYEKPPTPATLYRKDYFSFHSPELTFRGVYLNPSEIKVYKEYQGNVRGSFIEPFGHPKQKIPSYGAFLGALLLALGLTIQQFTGKKTMVAANIGDYTSVVRSKTLGLIVPFPGRKVESTAAALGGTGWSAGRKIGQSYGSDMGIQYPEIGTEDSAISTLNFNSKKGTLVANLLSWLQQVSMFVNVGTYYMSSNFGNIYKAFKELLPWVQYARQYNGVGNYNVAVNPRIGEMRRLVNKARYMADSLQQFDPTYIVNNINRPKSVVLNTSKPIADPIKVDKSRQTIGQRKIWTNPGQTTTAEISAYYAGLKINNPSQYGQVGGVAQVPIGTCVQPKTRSLSIPATSQIYFGGDTYINRYTEMNKFPFFSNWLFNLPDGTDFDYRLYANVPYPRYWATFSDFDLNDIKLLPGFPTLSGSPGLRSLIRFITRLIRVFGRIVANPFQGITRLVGGPSSTNYLDRNPIEYTFLGNLKQILKVKMYVKQAYFYLFCNGVKNFYCESEINLAARDYGAQPSEQFYNPYGFNNLSVLFRTDLITVPEFYKYDFSMSAGRLLSTYVSWGQTLTNAYDPNNQDCGEYYPNRLIYSLQQQREQSRDNWRIYLPNNYKDFENQISNVKTINRTGAIILFEDAIPTTINGVDELRTSAGNRITVGDAGLFNQSFQNLVNADLELEYGSCQSERSVINTPYGVFWISQRNGKVMHLYNNQITDISMNGMRFWFLENLPYNLLKQYPNFPYTDNPVRGVGCQSVYDNQFEIVYFMKRDYKKKNPLLTIEFDEEVGEFVVQGYVYDMSLTYGVSSSNQITNGRKVVGFVNGQQITACIYSNNITAFVQCLVAQIQACPNIKTVYYNINAYDFALTVYLINDTIPATINLQIELAGTIDVPPINPIPIPVTVQTEKVVQLTDPNYFEDCSWTVSYDPKIKLWISFHDWHPDLAFPSNDHFFTILNNTFWKHNNRCDNFGNFYNTNYGWEVEFPVNTQTAVTTIKSVEYYLEVFKYNINCSDRYHVLDSNFDQAVLYNTEQTSGILNLNIKPKSNPAAMLLYPKVNTSLDGIDILVAKEENKYRFNQFWDTARDRGEFSGRQITNFITECNGYRMNVNPGAVNYFKSPLERKKFRHYGNRVILRKTASGAEKMNLKVVYTKETSSPR